ncbi:hypothetical protein [Staphylococcus epidermidis]
MLADINYTKDNVMHMYHRINKGTDEPSKTQRFQRIFNYLYTIIKYE